MDAMKRQAGNGWTAALHILDRLRAAGHRALLAGGCVRDRLLAIAPKDYDIATSARPEEVLRLYPKARPVGVKFGVVLVRQAGHDVEVATFRTDGPYSDGRHPDHVQYGTAEQDAQRRDFTINGLFLDPLSDAVIDYVGGQGDLRAGVIRTIGAPAQRFAEDHLRMLRAVRFAARLGFTIEPETLSEMRRLAPCLPGISAERIAMELAAILTPATRIIGWRLLSETQLCAFLVTTWKPSAGELPGIALRLRALPSASIAFALALAALWGKETPAAARTHARALRCSNREVRTVSWLLSNLADVAKVDRLDLAALKRLRADRDWPLLPPLLHAALVADEADLAPHDRLLERVAAIPAEKITPPPLLTGDDLLSLGVPAGRGLGTVMDLLYTAQLNEEIASRAEAEAMVRLWQRDHPGERNA